MISEMKPKSSNLQSGVIPKPEHLNAPLLGRGAYKQPFKVTIWGLRDHSMEKVCYSLAALVLVGIEEVRAAGTAVYHRCQSVNNLLSADEKSQHFWTSIGARADDLLNIIYEYDSMINNLCFFMQTITL